MNPLPQLILFLVVLIALVAPGVCAAVALRIGRTLVDRIVLGAALGLGGAIVASSAVAHVDLRAFLPLWDGVLLGSVIWAGMAGRRARAAREAPKPPRLAAAERWLLLVLALVAVIRFGAVWDHELPRGWDPSFHLLLSHKIQLTHHAISDWRPFEDVPLNYPTGSHVLVAVLSTLTGIPVEAVFKWLIEALGVLTTAVVFVLARRASDEDADIALYAAIAYGLWAVMGSVAYGTWGGLPNELGMCLFLAALAVALLPDGTRGRAAVFGVLYAAIVLTHHHVMLASGVILVVFLLAWLVARPPGDAARTIFLGLIVAGVLSAFFWIPYLGHIRTLRATHVGQGGEPPQPLSGLAGSYGYLFLLVAVIGLGLHIVRRGRPFALIVPIAAATLVGLFVACEYVYPLVTGRRDTTLTPSRFVTDLTCFLSLYGGYAVARAAAATRLPRAVVVVACVLAGLTVVPAWVDLATPVQGPAGYVEACRWIAANTPADTVVDDRPVLAPAWTSFLTWRRAMATPLPDSEPIADAANRGAWVDAVVTGKQVPPAGTTIVAILPPNSYTSLPVLWRYPNGVSVVRLWPKD